MRNKFISFIAMTGLIFGTATTLFGQTKPAYKVKFNETPPAVQAGVRAFAGKAEIDDIDKKLRDGKNYYNVAFKKNGKHNETWFGEDGTLLAVAEGVGTPLKQFPDPV
ncbi:MAG: hypothetical protein M3Y82_01925, partial [Verrucomicrobiota bacterium]|nr:hypothetical protein [Verrucomicrobiota bacterium]